MHSYSFGIGGVDLSLRASENGFGEQSAPGARPAGGERVAAPRPRVWRCGGLELALDRPLIMGILNVTPDSFSDGGAHDDPRAAVDFAHAMIADGADIIDVGGESTRPGSDEVACADELARVLPVVGQLAGEGVTVSIDTRHPQVARACVDAGAAIINDVTGFRSPEMCEVARENDAGLVVMHMLGEPKTMQEDIRYDDVVADISAYLVARAHELEASGIARERICIDPGPGFGKTAEHNLALIAHTAEMASLGYPLMAAYSRKGFIGKVTGVEVAANRVSGSVAVALMALERGANVFRVHDVAQTREAFQMWEAVRGAE